MEKNDMEFNAELIKKLLNNYIVFYKKEIQDINLFSGIKYENIESTNIQMESFYAEMLEYSHSDESLKNVIPINENNTRYEKYIIYKNKKPYCTSKLLFTILIEMINLELEEPDSNYEIKLNKQINISNNISNNIKKNMNTEEIL